MCIECKQAANSRISKRRCPLDESNNVECSSVTSSGSRSDFDVRTPGMVTEPTDQIASNDISSGSNVQSSSDFVDMLNAMRVKRSRRAGPPA